MVVNGDFDPEQGQVSRALGNYMQTRVLVYNVGTDGTELSLVAKRDVNGLFNAIRAEGSNVHLVTSSGTNMYQFLGTPIENRIRFNNGNTAGTMAVRRENQDRVFSEIRQDVDSKYIPDYVNQLQATTSRTDR